MDVVWLKKDVRLRDHGPLAEIAQSMNPFLILYLYEPDQLSEPTVHGSHIQVVNEGLIDLDQQLCDHQGRDFVALTVCHAEAVNTLIEIHRQHRIGRLLAHEETGHFKSFERDIAVRKWCKSNDVFLVEYQQSGVQRGFKQRNDITKRLNTFLGRSLYPTPNMSLIRHRLVHSIQLPSQCQAPIALEELVEIPLEHRVDRPDRQRGGERTAMDFLDSFVGQRSLRFSTGISSPNTAWTSCSRLSIYLTWGHISLRSVVQAMKSRQEVLRVQQDQNGPSNNRLWLRSLFTFSSRLYGRAHCIQQLESEPMMEKRDLCHAYQILRRQEGDWNEQYYQAWATGNTGFPFVDACMRCLHQYGWMNFRMRAMLVSFATYNLWLDWKRIAPHLARLFLDYEPGIHYPQLQMQAGTTGINTMRVYNVTKQGKEQDPDGVFIKRHVPELRQIPTKYIHEPWTMPLSLQLRYAIAIGNHTSESLGKEFTQYPEPIVNEQESAKDAKSKVAAIRKKDETIVLAEKILVQHGSRRREMKNGKQSQKALSSTSQVGKQPSIQSMLKVPTLVLATTSHTIKPVGRPKRHEASTSIFTSALNTKRTRCEPETATDWDCETCTFINSDKPFALACGMCGTIRNK